MVLPDVDTRNKQQTPNLDSNKAGFITFGMTVQRGVWTSNGETFIVYLLITWFHKFNLKSIYFLFRIIPVFALFIDGYVKNVYVNFVINEGFFKFLWLFIDTKLGHS